MYSVHQTLIFHWIGLKFVLNIQENVYNIQISNMLF